MVRLKRLLEELLKIPLFLLFVTLSLLNQLDMWARYRRALRDLENRHR